MDLDKLIAEKWTGPTLRRFVTVEGCMLPERYEITKSDYDNLEVHNEDTWLCTFPKSGTTWSQEMVWLILHNLDFDGAKKNLQRRFPFLDLSITIDSNAVSKSNGEMLTRIEDSVSVVKNLEHPACIKTHLPKQLLPIQLREGIKKPKIIYVARDPRDVCVSFYHHCKLTQNCSLTFDEFVDLFLADKTYYGPYWDHVLPFWKIRHEPNILFLKYEDMKKDLKQVIRQVAKFLQRSLSDEDVEKLSEHLSFESMRANRAVNHESSVAMLQRMVGIQHEGKFMRKGVAGDYKNAMSPETIMKFDEWIAKNIEGTDYVV